jgi:SAM-dependent methyltransferase
MIRQFLALLKAKGPGTLLEAGYRRVVPHRLASFPHCKPSFTAAVGLELGGPSRVFGRRGSIPAYPLAARIDNCNFGHQTTWEGAIREGDTFVFDGAKPPGRQYVGEAGNLEFIGDAAYDFVLSSHCLEHLANPLRGLSEWLRVLRQGGLLVLIVPHKDGTFDHRRPVTSMEHLVRDFDEHTDEGDLTHLPEILKLHDLAQDPGAGDLHSFEERSRRNRENRCLHHHVFDTPLAVAVVDHVGLQILAVEAFRPFHIAVIARKTAPGQAVDNGKFRGIAAAPGWRSPFPSDRLASRR